ncbi:uncharacterized protein LOC131213368 [Anopheles bellator]|uniref:uncharacterized protein LOC131213368 n=1 Tax=Anopheles bellator TaxID=139047 RepID=UPI002648C539|nr:uncharacterized protein LOC131213368 [Anopheles bellator]
MDNNNATRMEFCEDLRQIQAILWSTNRSVRSFSKILFNTGNEQYITEIVAQLLRYLRQQNYLDAANKVIPQHAAQLRKIAMYLFLNTDASFLYDLNQDGRVGQLLCTAPQLSKCLLLNCIWDLNLDRFLYEMVSYSPLWFSTQFLHQTVTSLKYAKPFKQLERVEALVRSMNLAIYRTDRDWCRIYLRRFEPHEQIIDRTVENISECLYFVNTPDPSKFNDWSADRKHLYSYYVMKRLLRMTIACLKTFTGEPPDALPDSETLAMFNLFEENRNSITVWSTAPELTSAIRKRMMTINNLAFTTLEAHVSRISDECRHHWFITKVFSKFYGEQVDLSRVILESSYWLTWQAWSMQEYRNHRIGYVLGDLAMTPMSYRPFVLKANAMDLKLLMLKIDRTAMKDERYFYFNSFMKRKKQVFGNVECLAFVERHLLLVNGDHVRMMIEYDTSETDANEYLYGEDELPDKRVKLRKLILQLIPEMRPDSFGELVEFMIKTFGRDYVRYQQPNFMFEIDEFLLNYLQSNPVGFLNPKTVRLFVFQSPHIFFSSLIRLLYNTGWVQSEYYVDIAIMVFSTHRKIAQYYIAEYTEALLCDDFDSRLNATLCIMTRCLYERKLIDEEHFIEYFLLRVVKDACKNREHGALHKLLTRFAHLWPDLVTVYNPAKPNGNRIFHLAIAIGLAELIPGLRNDKYHHKEERHLVDHTYHHEEDSQPVDPIDLVTMIIELLEPTLDRLRSFSSAEELREILTKMTVEPLSTQYYFQKHFVIKATGAPSLSFAAFMYQDELRPPVDDERITTFLVQLLPQCTLTEAVGLAQDDMLKAHLFDALATLIDTLVEKQPSSYNSLGHRLANHILGLAKILLPTANTNEERNAWVKTLRHLFQRLPNEVWQVEAFILHLQASYRLIHNNDNDVDLELLQSYFNQHTH